METCEQRHCKLLTHAALQLSQSVTLQSPKYPTAQPVSYIAVPKVSYSSASYFAVPKISCSSASQLLCSPPNLLQLNHSVTLQSPKSPTAQPVSYFAVPKVSTEINRVPTRLGIKCWCNTSLAYNCNVSVISPPTYYVKPIQRVTRSVQH